MSLAFPSQARLLWVPEPKQCCGKCSVGVNVPRGWSPAWWGCGEYLRNWGRENTEFPCSSAFPINLLKPAPLFPHQNSLGQEWSPWQSSYQISAMDSWPLFPSPRNRTHSILNLGKCLPAAGPTVSKTSPQLLQRQPPSPTATL